MAQPCCRLVTKNMFHSKGVLSPYRPQTFGLEDWIMGPVLTYQDDGSITEVQGLGAWVDYQTCEKHGGYWGPGGGVWRLNDPSKKHHLCGLEMKE